MIRPTLLAMRNVHSDERGSFTTSQLATTLFLMIATVCAMNTFAEQRDRVQQQRKADAVAESLGNWKARNLNALVAHQHLMGELLGLVITHHAIGGELLDNQSAADTDNEDRALKLAYQAAQGCKTGTPAYSSVSRPVLADEALLKAHVKLKKLLAFVYGVKAVATAMQAYPPTAAAGAALEQAAHVLELAILAEWNSLESIRQAALALTPFKQAILKRTLPAAKKQLDKMVADYGITQQQLADELAMRMEIRIHILETDRRLPVVEDPLARLTQPPTNWKRPIDCDCPSPPTDNMRHQIAKVTQLSRATFPWVIYNRQPVMAAMTPLTPLTQLADLYFDHTNGVSKRLLDELQRDGQLALYTLDDYQGPDKAYEPWMNAEGASAADKTLGITVVIGSPTRKPIGDFFLPRNSIKFTFRYASAFVWSRHPPIQPAHRIDLYCKRIVPSMQAKTGWDTLNWAPNVVVSELVGIGRPHTFPAIEPAWTSRLNPTSPARLKELQQQQTPAWASELNSVLPDQVPADLSIL